MEIGLQAEETNDSDRRCSPATAEETDDSDSRCGPTATGPGLSVHSVQTVSTKLNLALTRSMASGRGRPASQQQTADVALLPAFQAAAIMTLGAWFGDKVQWSRSRGMPVISYLADLRCSPAFGALDTTVMLRNVSAPIPLEAAEGAWRSAHLPVGATLADKVSLFNRLVWPSRQRPSTRSKHWAYWSACVTWGLSTNVYRYA
jgi:hypothetical protein